MPRKTTYQHRWGIDPTRLDLHEIQAAVNVPGEIGIKLNEEQKKRWGEIVSHLAWRFKIGAGPGQAEVDKMLKEIESGVDQLLPALETIQNPMIKRVFGYNDADPPKAISLPPHLHARNISSLIASLKEWKETCHVELTHRKTRHKKGRPSDSSFDTAILTMGRFFYEVIGKKPYVYRTAHQQSKFKGQFLELVFETLIVLNVPYITENARNATGQRIERLKPKFKEMLEGKTA